MFKKRNMLQIWNLVEIRKNLAPLWKEEKIINIEATTHKKNILYTLLFSSSDSFSRVSSEDYQRRI